MKAFLAICFVAVAMPASAASISFNNVPGAVTVGQTFTFDVFIDDIVDLYLYQLTLAYAPAFLATVSADNGDLMDGTFFASSCDANLLPGDCAVDPGALSVSNVVVGPPSGVSTSDPVRLFSVTMKALQGGLAIALMLNMNSIGDGFLDSGFGDLTVSLPGAASLDVAGGQLPDPIPEPSSLILLGTGLAMGARRLARRRQQAR